MIKKSQNIKIRFYPKRHMYSPNMTRKLSISCQGYLKALMKYLASSCKQFKSNKAKFSRPMKFSKMFCKTLKKLENSLNQQLSLKLRIKDRK